MRVVLLSFVLTLILTGGVQAQYQEGQFKHLTNDEGLSQNTVFSILKDSKGFMWFGTRDGLNRYDGYAFTVYRNDAHNPSSISSNIINDLLEDKQGNVWVATTRGLDKFDRKTNTFSHYAPDKNPIFVKDIFQDRAGNLWLSTWSGLYAFNSKTSIFQAYKHSEKDSNSLFTDMVYRVAQDAAGDLWIANAAGLQRFNSQQKRFYHYQHNPKDDKSLAGNIVRTVFVDKKNNVWVGTGGFGLDLYNRETNSFTHFIHDPTNHQSLNNNYLLCITEGIDGKLWVGTENGGISILDEQTDRFTHYEYDINNLASLNSNSVRCMYKDDIGNMWIGTWAGGVNFMPKLKAKFVHYQPIPGAVNSLSNKNVKTLFEDQNRKVWIGTDGGGLNVLDRKTNVFSHYRQQPDNAGVASDYLHCVVPIDEDTIAIGYHNEGFDLFSRKTDKKLHFMLKERPLSSLFLKTVFCIYKDHQANLWLGTSGGGLYLFNRQTRTFTSFEADATDSTTISSNIIYSITADNAKNLWIATDNGLNYLNVKTGRFTRYQYDANDPKSLSNNIVNSVFQDSQNRIWVATGGGLNLLNKRTSDFTAYTERTGLPNNVIYGILEDRHGDLWLSSNKGIIRFNPKTTISRSYTTADGVQGNEFIRGAYYQNAQGEMFFGGVNGFNIFHPDSLQDNPFVPPVVLTGLQIFNNSVVSGVEGSPLQIDITESKEITLSHEQSVFTFTYAAMNFTQSENNQYAYKLEGFDQDWNYVGTKRSATYTNLDPGDYTFMVKGSNNDGVWNEKATVMHIYVTPTWWQSKWFKFLIIAGLTMLVVGYYRYRLSSIQQHNIQLEKLVVERTLNLQVANQEVMEANQELVLREEEIKAQNEDLLRQREELVIQNQEIVLQKDLLAKQNEQLDTAGKIIEQQNTSLDREVKERTKELVEYTHQLEQFAFIAAHNLRAPVARILGLGQVIKLPGITEEEEKMLIDKLIFTTEELDQVVTDLNTILEIRKNNTLTLSEIDLNEELRLIHTNLENEISETKAVIIEDFSKVSHIYSVKPYIDSILFNLIHNAIKYRDPIRKPRIQVKTEVFEDYICLSVSDNGLGIDLEYHQKNIFNLYKRFHTHVEGKGMGLYLVKTQVIALGGKIEVYSKVNRGTIFKVFLRNSIHPTMGMAG